MWGAIKSDLLSFVTTITDDTTKTINRVLGDKEEEVNKTGSLNSSIVFTNNTFVKQEEDVSVQEKLVADLRRSFETYNTVSSDLIGNLLFISSVILVETSTAYSRC